MIATALLFSTTAASGSWTTSSEINDKSAISAGNGVVRISIRSQLQYAAPLYVWFAKVSDGKVDTDHAISFSRTQGVPLAGSNMTYSRPRYHSLAPGHYRLVAHTMTCMRVPPPGTVCVVYGKPVPTGRYDDQSVEFDVASGQLTDAGEFILELPPEVDLGGQVTYKQAYKLMPSAKIRWKKIISPLEHTFADIPQAHAPFVPDTLKSNITCDTKPKGMGMFYPFKC